MKKFFVLLALLLFSHSNGARVLISTVAQVKKRVITSREVAYTSLLAKTLEKEWNSFGAQNANEQVVREWLLFFEASSFYSNRISDEDVNKWQKLAEDSLSNQAVWKSLAVTKKELKNKLSRHLEARRLFFFKEKASALPVSDSEIEAEYNKNRIRYGNLSFEEAKEKIRASRKNANLRERLEQWFLILEKKYKVQRFKTQKSA